MTTWKFVENNLNSTPGTSIDPIGEVMQISHDKLPLMPKNSAFMFNHNFYPKPKVDLGDSNITQETRQKILDLQQKYDDILSTHSSNISLTHLEEMKIDTEPNLPPVTSKPHPLPLKHHTFIRRNWTITRSRTNQMIYESICHPHHSSPRKSKPGAPLVETKRLVIDYCELNKQIPKIQTTQANLKAAKH